MGILKTATLALLLMGGNDLEKKVQQPAFTAVSEDNSKYVTIGGKTYRQRPPRECCDPTLYGTPVKEEPQKEVPRGLYLGLAALAVALISYSQRKKAEEMTEKKITEKRQSEREWDFCGTRPPIVDYKDREGRRL